MRRPTKRSTTTEVKARPQGSVAVRAVGRANGDNRIAIVVPCHRVVGADGKLTGYGGGLWRKRYLLDLESRNRATSPENALRTDYHLACGRSCGT